MPLQLHQFINLFALLLLGSWVASIHLAGIDITIILLYTLCLEHLFLYLNPRRGFYLSYASLSTAIGVIVLMYTPHLWIYLLVIGLGLAQKHFLLLDQRHLFNPSNFALIMALLFFYHEAHIISGQFGDALWLSLLVSFLAIIILIRSKRWVIPLAFILSYFLLEYVLVVRYDPVMIFEDIYHRLYSVTFVLFIYFMLTDPLVTPSLWRGQLLFAFGVALLATLLDRFYGFRVQHLFMSVFFISPLVTLCRAKFDGLTRVKLLGIILPVTVAILLTIEMQAPYYFEMNG